MVMRTTALVGVVMAASIALGGCALPLSKSVETLPPSSQPRPTATEQTPEDRAYDAMSSNWFNLSTAEQDRLCSYWKNNPNQAWESLQSSEVGEYLSKSKFTEFFASHCY
jgi:hypothetical protein